MLSCGSKRWLPCGWLAALLAALVALPPRVPAQAVPEPSTVAPAVASPAPGDSALVGQWRGVLPIEAGETSQLVLDLGVLGSRWVGEFDLIELGVDNYPVAVSWVGHQPTLYFAGIDADFTGTIAADGQTLVVTQAEEERVTLRMTGAPQFSERFLALEAAADDSTRVARLGSDSHELRKRFNHDRDKPRLVVLLSPT